MASNDKDKQNQESAMMGPPKAEQSLDLSSYLAAENLSYAGKSSAPGKIKVIDKETEQEAELDLAAALDAEGLDATKVAINYNKPEEALNVGPSKLTTADRARLSLGNDKGKLKYLKDKFEDVQINPESGIVVKEDGEWKTVDPAGPSAWIKDPWEFAKDVADLTDVGIGVGAGVAATAATGGNPFAGAAAGGAASGGIRTSLGRIVGTYEADAEETIKDITLETVLSLGGQAIVAGAKPTYSMLKSAISKMPAVAKETAAGTLGMLNGTGADATKVMLNQTDDVIRAIKSTGASDVKQIRTALQQQNREIVTEMFEEANQKHVSNYGKALNEMIDAADKAGSEVDIRNVYKTMIDDINNLNFGKVKATVQGVGGKKAMRVDELLQKATGAKEALTTAEMQELKVLVPKGAKLQLNFTPHDDIKIGELARAGQQIEQLSPAVQNELNSVLNKISRYSAISIDDVLNGQVPGKFKGKSAASILNQINKDINAFSKSAYSAAGADAPSMQRLATKLTESTKNGVSQEFDRIGLGAQAKAMNDAYAKNANTIQKVRKALDSTDGTAMSDYLDQFISKLSPARKAGEAKASQMADDITELLGPQTKEKFNQVLVNEVAGRYSDWMPKMFTGITAGAVAGSQGLVAGAPLLAMASPRAGAEVINAFKQGATKVAINPAKKLMDNSLVRYALDMKDFISGLGAAGAAKLSSNPTLLNAVLRQPIVAAGQELNDTQALMEQINGPKQ